MESFLIRDLSFTYPDRDMPALKGVSMEIGQGQFVTLCGPSGGGKTTLLRLLKPIIAPHGEKSGEILFCGEPVESLDQRTQSEKIGLVIQSVENQLVTDKVWHELAFGLESLGYSTSEIRLKVAEMAAFFGIDAWFYENVAELSGGQKQLLNLASVMAMHPSVLMLDEPTSQLDPIAASDFLAIIGKINRELGVTVIMTEHRLEEVFPLSDRVVCLDGGEVVCDDSPRRVGEILRERGHSMVLALPTPMRIWAGVRAKTLTGAGDRARDISDPGDNTTGHEPGATGHEPELSNRADGAGVYEPGLSDWGDGAGDRARDAGDPGDNTTGHEPGATGHEPGSGDRENGADAHDLGSGDWGDGDGDRARDAGGKCPVTVRDGRVWFDRLLDSGASAACAGAAYAYTEYDIQNTVPEEDAGRNSGAVSLSAAAPHGHNGAAFPFSGSPAADPQIPAIEMNGVWYRYEKDTPDVVRRLTLTVNKGEFLCIVGGNGAGKTTALSLIAGLGKPQRGTVKLFGESVLQIPPARMFSDEGDGGIIGILPQNPQSLFVKKTVREDLLEIFLGRKVSREDKEKRLQYVSRLCHVENLLNAHPYDLSGGEQQRAALAKILLLRPRILLLDEPTKGLDAGFKREFAMILKNLAANGVTIVLVSHDIEFCAEHGDRCAMFFDGSIVTQAPPREFFSGNSFYTTAANRMVRHRFPRAITANDVIRALGAVIVEYGIQDTKPEAASPEDASLDASQDVSPDMSQDASQDASRDVSPDMSRDVGQNVSPEDVSRDMSQYASQDVNPQPAADGSVNATNKLKTLPLRRKLFIAAAALVLIGAIVMIIINFSGFLAFISGGSEAERAMQEHGVWRYAAMLITLCAAGFLLAVSTTGSRRDEPSAPHADKTETPRAGKTEAPHADKTETPRADKTETPHAGKTETPHADKTETPPRRLPKRTLLATVMALIAIPLTILIGVYFLGDRRYYFISMLIILETMLPFALVFEGRKPQAREIVVIAVLCALGVAGRTAFFVLPHVKPVVALAIITGVAFGGEAGFLFGAMTGFLSNMFFGQGAWTPWQMFAYGIIGFLAGVMFRKGLLPKNRTVLCVFGGLASLVIYGGLMNASSVLMYQANPTPAMFLIYMVQGLPFDLIHAASTAMFLAVLAYPMLEKLDRIKVKYGMLR